MKSGASSTRCPTLYSVESLDALFAVSKGPYKVLRAQIAQNHGIVTKKYISQSGFCQFALQKNCALAAQCAAKRKVWNASRRCDKHHDVALYIRYTIYCYPILRLLLMGL